jgi:phosphomannomutase / phosphoglucomutase
MIISNIFRKYDIRGVYGKEISVDVSRRIGWAFGKLLTETTNTKDLTVAIGIDSRTSARKLFDSFVDGLSNWGIKVIDIGMCPTPLLYFSLHTMPIHGGVMITASHNPSEYNGFKLCVGRDTIFGEDIQKLFEFATKVDISKFQKRAKFQRIVISKHDIIKDYTVFILKHFPHLKKLQSKSPVRVVIDSGNGTAGLVAPDLFRSLGFEVYELFSEPDGTFPNHHPDPTVEENLTVLKGKILGVNADVGFAFDGDADRLGVLDGKGRLLWGDQLLTIFAEDIINENPGATFIGEVKCSKVMYDEIERLGGKAIMWKTGHSLIKKKMKETGALLAGEMSGHIFFKHRYFGYDDAIYAALRFLELLIMRNSKDEKSSLVGIIDNLPHVWNTPEIRFFCDDDKKFIIIEKIKENMSNKYEFNDIDGVRVNFKNGWGLIRASNTQPALIMRFESDSKKGLKEIEDLLRGELEKALQSM